MSLRRAATYLLPVAILFTAHYISANAYAAICAPFSLKGIFLSFFTTSSPVCTTLLGVLNFTSNGYALALGSVLTAVIAVITNATAQPSSVKVIPGEAVTGSR